MKTFCLQNRNHKNPGSWLVRKNFSQSKLKSKIVRSRSWACDWIELTPRKDRGVQNLQCAISRDLASVVACATRVPLRRHWFSQSYKNNACISIDSSKEWNHEKTIGSGCSVRYHWGVAHDFVSAPWLLAYRIFSWACRWSLVQSRDILHLRLSRNIGACFCADYLVEIWKCATLWTADSQSVLEPSFMDLVFYCYWSQVGVIDWFLLVSGIDFCCSSVMDSTRYFSNSPYHLYANTSITIPTVPMENGTFLLSSDTDEEERNRARMEYLRNFDSGFLLGSTVLRSLATLFLVLALCWQLKYRSGGTSRNERYIWRWLMVSRI